jgi:hypothetical protein
MSTRTYGTTKATGSASIFDASRRAAATQRRPLGDPDRMGASVWRCSACGRDNPVSKSACRYCLSARVEMTVPA